jgi:hypothetical protein
MKHQPVSRRNFGRRAALAAALGALAAEPAVPQGRGPQTPLPASDQAEVDAKYSDVIRKYGERLSEDQKTRVRGVIGRHQRMLLRVRQFPLENGDAPATALRLYPKDTKE